MPLGMDLKNVMRGTALVSDLVRLLFYRCQLQHRLAYNLELY
jgi:hypothetical protein